MSPRRNHRNARPRPEGRPEDHTRYGLESTESWQGESWVVRQVAGSSGKHYRCPGCDQLIPPGTGHVVAWEQHGTVDDRRHWHRACWNARDRRGTRPQRSRNAPRY
ncbi:ATP/GTP-binding protein [Streptomyces bohaiensis]|uniref:ATP/GTP-binding protein n=1 Tax=Streptomyces bohaiensis TaxID=1431344 RepID=A0ABX1C3F0_9ACTN|nr:ATP/GTP-binding protein [Streptomyces bohaiensis]NJQ13754.1 ATP/GTP-binding protein [Streptomyces bohaiensis]